MRHRWGLASRRLCLGAESLVFRSPVTSSGAEGVGLVPVEAVASREPHRQSVRWGSPDRLTRFLGIESAPWDRPVPAWVAETARVGDVGARGALTSGRGTQILSPTPAGRRPPHPDHSRNIHMETMIILT